VVLLCTGIQRIVVHEGGPLPTGLAPPRSSSALRGPLTSGPFSRLGFGALSSLPGHVGQETRGRTLV